MRLYERMRTYFDPELRAKKEYAVACADEAARRKLAADAADDASVLSGNPIIVDIRNSILAWSASVMPYEQMDAAACFWFKRGLEQAVKVLDDRVSPSAEE